MLQASAHLIHLKRILAFGESQRQRSSLRWRAGPDDPVDGLALPVVLNHGKACSRPGCHNEMPLFHELEVQGDAHAVHQDHTLIE